MCPSGVTIVQCERSVQTAWIRKNRSNLHEGQWFNEVYIWLYKDYRLIILHDNKKSPDKPGIFTETYTQSGGSQCSQFNLILVCLLLQAHEEEENALYPTSLEGEQQHLQRSEIWKKNESWRTGLSERAFPLRRIFFLLMTASWSFPWDMDWTRMGMFLLFSQMENHLMGRSKLRARWPRGIAAMCVLMSLLWLPASLQYQYKSFLSRRRPDRERTFWGHNVVHSWAAYIRK